MKALRMIEDDALASIGATCSKPVDPAEDIAEDADNELTVDDDWSIDGLIDGDDCIIELEIDEADENELNELDAFGPVEDEENELTVDDDWLIDESTDDDDCTTELEIDEADEYELSELDAFGPVEELVVWLEPVVDVDGDDNGVSVDDDWLTDSLTDDKDGKIGLDDDGVDDNELNEFVMDEATVAVDPVGELVVKLAPVEVDCTGKTEGIKDLVWNTFPSADATTTDWLIGSRVNVNADWYSMMPQGPRGYCGFEKSCVMINERDVPLYIHRWAAGYERSDIWSSFIKI